MLKKVLSEQFIIYGDVSMPEGFEINSLELIKSIFESLYNKKGNSFCKDWSKLDSYARELKNSPDFTLLYGIYTKDCFVKIHYDDNRCKGLSFDIELKHNMFVIFPSTNIYSIDNNQKDSLNFIQTITYELK